MDYRETIDFLFTSLPMFQNVGGPAYKEGLDNTRALDEFSGFPHRGFLTIHIAGTNGKGSVSHMIASVLQSAGYRTGLFTSPHLYDFRERIRIDGEMIGEQDVVDYVGRIGDMMKSVKPSFFEMTFSMAMDYFARSGVEVAVVETGMGGRLDSTNIVTPLVSVITNISKDHTAYLGETIAEIAAEKAGIIKPGVPVVIGESSPESAPLFIMKAHDCETPIIFADKLYASTGSRPAAGGYGQVIDIRSLTDGYEFELETDLGGIYQKKNILTVIAALETLAQGGALKFTRSDIERGLRSAAHSTGLYGRWQVIGENPLTVCDTAHNEAGIAQVTEQLRGCSYRKLFIIFGVVRDKDLNRMLSLMPRDAWYIFTRAPIERAMDENTLASLAATHGLQGETVPDVATALSLAREKASPEDMIFIGGSTFTVAQLHPSTLRG